MAQIVVASEKHSKKISSFRQSTKTCNCEIVFKTKSKNKNTGYFFVVVFVCIAAVLINHFIERGLLVAGPRDDVLVVGRDVTTENGTRLLRDEDGRSVGSAPGIEKIVLSS